MGQNTLFPSCTSSSSTVCRALSTVVWFVPVKWLTDVFVSLSVPSSRESVRNNWIDAEVCSSSSSITLQGNVFNEANGNAYFDATSPSKELQFWRNLRKNNVRINENYPYVSRIDNNFVFVSVGFDCPYDSQSADKPIVFHSYISRNVSILRDEHVIVDEDVKDAKTKHGVLIYGCNLAIPFIPKYLSINVDSSTII